MYQKISRGTVIALIAAAGFLIIFSFPTLDTKPRIGVDEALVIEGAHNLADSLVLSIATSPGEFVAYPYYLFSNGYPVALSLAPVFKVFGFGVAEARVVMILWMLVLLCTIFYVMRRLWNEVSALFAVLLVVTFATFYEFGRTATGEVPGLVFFLWGLYLLSIRQRVGLTGVLFGLAIATKASLYLSLLPVLLLHVLWERRTYSLSALAQLGMGIAIPVGVWVVWMFPPLWSLETWKEVFSFLGNPWGTSISEHIRDNIPVVLESTTFHYFFLIAAIATIMFFLERRVLPDDSRMFLRFSLLVSAFGLFYFLRSPGWIRYFFASEILLLMLLYPSLERLLPHARKLGVFLAGMPRDVVIVGMSFLVAVQFVHLFTFSSIRASHVPQEIAAYLMDDLTLRGGVVGILNNHQVASLIPQEERYQQFYLVGVPPVGTNPLSLPPTLLPRLLLLNIKDKEMLVGEYGDMLETQYQEKKVFEDKHYLYEHIPL